MTYNDIKEYLFNMIEENRIVHSIIMEGVSSEEDKEPAYSFVRRLMGSLDNLDIIIPRHEKPHLISVEEARSQIVDNALIKPYGNAYKIYLIEGDLLRVDGQNTLLKTLEEPPAYAIFIIFVKSASALLPTIRSRCRLLSLTHEDKIAKYSENEQRIAEIGRLAVSGNAIDASGFSKEITAFVKAEKLTYPQIFDVLRKVYADEVLKKEGIREKYLEGDMVLGQDAAQTERSFFSRIQAVCEAEEKIKRSVNADLVLRKLFLDIKTGEI